MNNNWLANEDDGKRQLVTAGPHINFNAAGTAVDLIRKSDMLDDLPAERRLILCLGLSRPLQDKWYLMLNGVIVLRTVTRSWLAPLRVQNRKK